MLIFLGNFLLFRLRVTWADRRALLSLVGVVADGQPRRLARLLALDLNFGDALMLVAVVAYTGYTVALRFKPAIHWQSLMIALTAGPSWPRSPSRSAEAHPGLTSTRRGGLGSHPLHRLFSRQCCRNSSNERRRLDRHQPRRTVRQPHSGFRDAAVDGDARRGFHLYHASRWPWCSAASGSPSISGRKPRRSSP